MGVVTGQKWSSQKWSSQNQTGRIACYTYESLCVLVDECFNIAATVLIYLYITLMLIEEHGVRVYSSSNPDKSIPSIRVFFILVLVCCNTLFLMVCYDLCLIWCVMHTLNGVRIATSSAHCTWCAVHTFLTAI